MGLAVAGSIVSNKGCTPELINERMMVRMNLTGKSNSVSVIVAYAPTETAPLEDKVLFWTQLGKIVKTVPKKDQLFLLIDATARTGSRNRKV